MAVNYVAPGMTAVTPYLFIEGVDKAITFYEKVLGAQKRYVIPGPDGKVMHGEIEINGAVVMMGEPNPQYGGRSPKGDTKRSAGLYVYVPDVDATLKKAVAGGGTVVMEPSDMFYGDRVGGFVDPYGHHWTVGTHIEDVPPEEMDQRAKDWAKKAAG